MHLKEPRAATAVLALLALGGCHSLFPFAGPKTDGPVSDRPGAADRAGTLPDGQAKEGGSAKDWPLDRPELADRPRDQRSKADRLPDKPSMTLEGVSPCVSWDCTALVPYGCLAVCKNGMPLFKCTNGTCKCSSCLSSCTSSECTASIGGALQCEQCYTAFTKIAPCCTN